MTKVNYLFSSPEGEFQATTSLLKKNIKTDEYSATQRITLFDYFHSLEDLILLHYGKILSINGPSPRKNHQVKELSIVMEKCGTFYHIARIKIITDSSERQDFALITAFDKYSRAVLKRDYQILSHLWKDRLHKVVPRPLYIADVEIHSANESCQATVSVMEWLEGFWEWHFSQIGRDNLFQIVVWQPGVGITPLPEKGYEKKIFEKIGEIIAYCFDPVGLKQVCLWNNAAGDFVIRWDKKGVFSAKLTTIREYSCVPSPDPLSKEERLLFALLYLFLDLMLNIRLDRIDGTGCHFFARADLLKPAIKGFLRGLKALKDEKGIPSDSLWDLFSLLISLNSRDLFDLYQGLMAFYKRWNRNDYEFLQKRLAEHCSQLATMLKQLYSSSTANEILSATTTPLLPGHPSRQT